MASAQPCQFLGFPGEFGALRLLSNERSGCVVARVVVPLGCLAIVVRDALERGHSCLRVVLQFLKDGFLVTLFLRSSPCLDLAQCKFLTTGEFVKRRRLLIGLCREARTDDFSNCADQYVFDLRGIPPWLFVIDLGEIGLVAAFGEHAF